MRTESVAREITMVNSDSRTSNDGPPAPVKSFCSKLGLAKGQSAPEYAAVALLFFAILFAVMDYSWLFFAQMNVQQAIDDGGRFASTGDHLTNSSGGTESRIQSIQNTIQNEISVPNINVATSLSICSVNGGCSSSGGSAPAGGPDDTVTLSLPVSLPIWTPWLSTFFTGGNYNFTATTTYKNEPFNPSNTN
jgi:Flp pilus assembly protein TadG